MILDNPDILSRPTITSIGAAIDQASGSSDGLEVQVMLEHNIEQERMIERRIVQDRSGHGSNGCSVESTEDLESI
ncbi:hypothetical protein V5O48_006432, partial [Marasmius crinis-equi]